MDSAIGLKKQLSHTLPEFMVPGLVTLIDALPLSVNGKVDRQALWRTTTRPQNGAFVEPRTELEQGLAAIWAELLGVLADWSHRRFLRPRWTFSSGESCWSPEAKARLGIEAIV